MEFPKKRKTEENGDYDYSPPPSSAITSLTPQDLRNILQPFSQDQLLDILQAAGLRHPDVLDAIRSVADRDTTLRKLFVRGLACETTTDALRGVFSAFGPIEEAVVIFDKATGRSKGYGFVTFRHVDGALLALKVPSKKIDGRMTVTQLASAGVSNSDGDVWARKVFVGNVPFEISSERLLSHFQRYGEVEEGPLGFDKGSGKTRGFAFFVYKTEEGARAALVEPIKTIDGYQVNCKLAVDGKKGKPATQTPTTAPPSGFSGDGVSDQQQQQSSLHAPPMLVSSQYGGYGGGHHQGHPTLPGNSYGMQSLGPWFGTPVGGGGYGHGIGGPFGDYGGRLPPNPAGMPAGGFRDESPHQQPMPIPRFPPRGMFQGMPPYY